MNDKMELLIVIGFIYLLYYPFLVICNMFKNRKDIYKKLYLVPYVEVIIAMLLCYFGVAGYFESDVLFLLTILFLLLPFVHMVMYYCIPYWKTKIPRDQGLRMMLFVFGYCAVMIGMLYYLNPYAD